MAERRGPTELAPEVERAAGRLRPHLEETPVLRSGPLSERLGAQVWLKLENRQRTGSFKVRGALNRMLCLSAEERSRGVVAASTGNHGAAVAFCGRRLRVPVEIYVPEEAMAAKVAVIESYGVEVRRVAGEPLDAELAARRRAEEAGTLYLSPYNDWLVIAGQGTVGFEIGRQLPVCEELYVSVGGGGLISGTAAWLRAARPGTRVIGCSPEASPVMMESVRAGRIVELPPRPTLSDATAGGLEPGAITFGLCRDLVDDWIAVSEQEIRRALDLFVDWHEMPIEGSAAVAVAALLRRGAAGRRTVGVVLCGGNVRPAGRGSATENRT